MTRERFGRHLHTVLSGQLGCGLGGGAGTQGLGKGGIGLRQLLGLMQCRHRGMFDLGGGRLLVAIEPLLREIPAQERRP
jgi:hypothetical protein